MALRVRIGTHEVVCAAEEPPMPGDFYVPDGIHGALQDHILKVGPGTLHTRASVYCRKHHLGEEGKIVPNLREYAVAREGRFYAMRLTAEERQRMRERLPYLDWGDVDRLLDALDASESARAALRGILEDYPGILDDTKLFAWEKTARAVLARDKELG